MKKYIFTFIAIVFIMLGLTEIKAYAYSETAVTPEQLQTALTAFKNRIDTYSNWSSLLEGKTRYYTIFYDSSGYYIYLDTKRPVVIPGGTGEIYNLDNLPVLKVYPQESDNYNVSMAVNSSGGYTLPTSMYTGDSGPHNFWKNPDRSVYYTSYDLYNYPDNAWLRSAVSIGTKYSPTNAQVAGPEYVRDATAVPTPSNARIQWILPKGLFPKIRESQIKLTWTPTSGALRTEVYIGYNYKSGEDKISKLLPFITYSDGLFASVGEVTKLLQTDIETFIHNKNASTIGQTFENGKLNLLYYYVRYVTPKDGKLAYGNWVKIDLVTGRSSLDTGDIVAQYDEVYTDDDGNEIEVTDSEYNGIQIDNDGKTVDPATLRSLTDYLMAIPNILDTLFTGFYSLLNGAGKFGQVFGVLFGFLPPEATVIIVTGIGALVTVGIIKVLK